MKTIRPASGTSTIKKAIAKKQTPSRFMREGVFCLKNLVSIAIDDGVEEPKNQRLVQPPRAKDEGNHEPT